MRIKIIPLVGCLLIALVIFQGLAANGGDKENDTTDQCPFGIIEGPDPIGFTSCYVDPQEKSGVRARARHRLHHLGRGGLGPRGVRDLILGRRA